MEVSLCANALEKEINLYVPFLDMINSNFDSGTCLREGNSEFKLSKST